MIFLFLIKTCFYNQDIVFILKKDNDSHKKKHVFCRDEKEINEQESFTYFSLLMKIIEIFINIHFNDF
jgi:hypothetical protein